MRGGRNKLGGAGNAAVLGHAVSPRAVTRRTRIVPNLSFVIRPERTVA
jgi:hypothetical protein